MAVMPSILNVQAPFGNLTPETLKATFEGSRSPLIVTDNLRPDNPIIYCNQAFLDLIGYEYTDVIGKNCRFLQGDDSDPDAIAALRNAVKKGEYVRVSIKNYKKDGTPFWNDLVMSPLTDDEGVVTHFMGMQLDITERVEAEQALRDQSAALERSNHELEQFTYATSHDLQEPLRMINSYTQLLTKRYGATLDDDARTFLKFATEGAERMQDLINDLLILSRVSDENDRFRTIDLAEVITRAQANLKVVIDDLKPEIVVHDVPRLKVDPVQMTQLFQNLIGNALKYHRTDVRPEVTISAAKQPGGYEFTVADNGIGISAKHLSRVFVIFQRLHTRKEYPGTGVGLAICSKIIDRHGGRIWVESEEGVGSQFKFFIPTKA